MGLVAVVAGLALSTGEAAADAWCDEPWASASPTEVPAGCPVELWMIEDVPVYRWDGGVRGEALVGTPVQEGIMSFGANVSCIPGECAIRERDFVFYFDRVHFTLADPPGSTVAIGDASQALVEYAITDAGGCPVPVAPERRCGPDPAECHVGCEDDGGCVASAPGRGGGAAPTVMIAVASLALAFVTRRRRRR